MRKVIAFIADRLASAHTDIRSDYEIVSVRGARHGVIQQNGQECDFVIVQFPDQLRGLELSEFVFLPSSITMKSMHRDEMEWIAKSRLR